MRIASARKQEREVSLLSHLFRRKAHSARRPFPAMERRTGFEPARPAWKAGMLPTTLAARVPPQKGRMGDNMK